MFVYMELSKKRKMLIEEEAAAMRCGSNHCIKELRDEINVLLDREARMWNQRSRILWLNKGDANTKLFHSRASHRVKKILILGINDSHGLWKENHDDIVDVLLGNYKELFTSSNPALSHSMLDQIPQTISNDMKQPLTCKFEDWEVATALKQMAPMKALGPNGMPLFF